jgi:spermidine synthase
MSKSFEELDRQPTPLGEVSLRRRLHPALGVDLYEVKLGDEHLMSSLFTAAEEQLAHLAIDVLAPDRAPFDVAVGGLGLGYTAAAALDHPEVGRVEVIDALAPVIDWHGRGLVPLGPRLTADERCRFHHADFFARVGAAPPLVLGGPDRYHAILVDIDHTPAHHLHGDHAGFYTAAAVSALAAHLRPGGAFSLWSDDPPDQPFLDLLAAAFDTADAHEISVPHPITGGAATNTGYLARLGDRPEPS